jgi:hypothetical protein
VGYFASRKTSTTFPNNIPLQKTQIGHFHIIIMLHYYYSGFSGGGCGGGGCGIVEGVYIDAVLLEMFPELNIGNSRRNIFNHNNHPQTTITTLLCLIIRRV